jgi:hypothetical protein
MDTLRHIYMNDHFIAWYRHFNKKWPGKNKLYKALPSTFSVLEMLIGRTAL